MPENRRSTEADEERLSHSYVSRLSISMLALPAHDERNGVVPSTSEFYDAIVQWLDKDQRVKVFKPIASADNVITESMFSMAQGSVDDAHENHAPAPNLHVHVARFERPIAMKINIAKRHQIQDRGDEAIPAEDYFVTWDGIQVLAMWPATPGKSDTGFYGGFAALDLIGEAVAAAGLRLLVQPCGPFCEYPFAHRDMFISESDSITEFAVNDRDFRSVDLLCSPEKDALVLLTKIASRLAFTTRTYARMTSFGTTVAANDSAARREMAKLLRYQYDLAQTSAIALIRSIGARWSNRGKPKAMALLTAGLWLRLAAIEDNRRRWNNARAGFESSGRYGEQKIFAIEASEGRESVESVDVEDLRAAVDRMSQRADSRTITGATVGGAIAGGAVGGIIALVAAISTASGTP